MKKYLMIGAAALLMGASFTSCSKDKDLYDPQANAMKFLQDYQAAFISVFGTPAANQTWGFGDTTASSRMTRGVFANGNEWAANDRSDCMYKVPPVLTDEQIAVVKKYFQTVRKPDYQDPQWTDYFIQQVYKGNPATAGAYSPEQYTAADGHTQILASDNMDHLAAINGDFVDHNNNFNHGDCGVYGNVLNYKGTLTTVEETYPVNSGNEYRHADKINLMTNSTTASFGYYNSNGSVRRTEYTGLVNFQTIIDALGAEANCLNDGWNRSFMGFDFEQMVDDEIYAKVGWGDNPDDWAYYTYNNQQYHYLNSNMNMYCGDLKEYNDLNGVDIAGLLADGYLPVSGSADKKWVKVGGCADGYYSDWIVTLTKAEKYDNTPDPTTKSIRIMAEDVAASAGSDIDFNDVVFDVEADFGESETVSEVTITVHAAGGTIPLYIGTPSNPKFREAHHELGIDDTRTMINTNAQPYADGVDYFAIDGQSAEPFTLPVTINKATFLEDVNNNVVITVTNQGTDVTVSATRGQAAGKIAVPVGTPWAKEKVNMGDAFSQFKTWVNTAAPTNWYNSYVSSRVLR